MRLPSPTIKTQPRKDNRKMPVRFLQQTQLQQCQKMPEEHRGTDTKQVFADTKKSGCPATETPLEYRWNSTGMALEVYQNTIGMLWNGTEMS